VDLNLDPDHCGRCFNLCETGFCVDGECIDQDIGHVVLIGHNYEEARPAQQRLLGNAVLMPLGGGPEQEVRVLAYGGAAALPPGSPFDPIAAAVDSVAQVTGQSWILTTLNDPRGLPTSIAHHDVFLIYEQLQTGDEDLRSLGTAWAPTLWDFAAVGGVIVVVDGGSGNQGSWQILDAAGLVRILGAVRAENSTAAISRPSDAIARGMPSAYLAERASVSYMTPETDVVVRNSEGPMALHLTFNPTETE
jgi:hypothetical protein